MFSYDMLEQCGGIIEGKRSSLQRAALDISLLNEKYRAGLSLGCDGLSNRFYCDEKLTCIEKGRVCDGRMDCIDGTDEQDCGLPHVCIDKAGHAVGVGDSYERPGTSCMFCMCNRNRSREVCYSPTCAGTANCHLDPNSVCCKCLGIVPGYRYVHWGTAKRIVLTSLLVVLIATVIVAFSRQIVRRHAFYNQLRIRRHMPDGRGAIDCLDDEDLRHHRLPTTTTATVVDPPPPSYRDLYKYDSLRSSASSSGGRGQSLSELPPSYHGSQLSLTTSDGSVVDAPPPQQQQQLPSAAPVEVVATRGDGTGLEQGEQENRADVAATA